jgi:hypothetical protein
MQLTEHFSLEELTFSSTATVRGIDNTPSSETVANLSVLAVALEAVRALLGFPLRIDSGYRCPALNVAVRGVPDSAHLTGFAADFICPQFGVPLEIVKKIAGGSGIRFDQLIQEGTWVHLSVAPTMRQEVLTAHFVNGVASYQHGIEVS